MAAAARVDARLTPFQSAIAAIRLTCLAFSAAIAGPAASDHHWRVAGFGLALVVTHAVLALAPVARRPRRGEGVLALAALAVHVAAVVATGGWESSYVFPLLGVLAIYGFLLGLRRVLPAAAVVAAIVCTVSGLGWLDLTWSFSTARQWVLELFLVAGVAGYAQRILGRAETASSEAMAWVQQLTDANQLLSSLHRVARTLPAQLDLDGVLDEIVASLRRNLAYDGAVILLADDSLGERLWQPVRVDGVRELGPLRDDELPPGAIAALTRTTPVADETSPRVGARRDRFRPRAALGVYTALTARGTVVGLLAVEFDHITAATLDRAERVCDGLAEPSGLGIDNARWFGRLRLLGADEERTRLANDLHDGVGQTLAYLGLELDRIKRAAADSPISGDLDRLRGDLRVALGEVRETLFDLKSDVTDTVDVGGALERCCARVRDRSGLKVTLDTSGSGRLARRLEHDLWRVAQEAILAAERQWNASMIAVRWWCDGERAELELTHDGAGRFGRRRGDTAELAVVRERADAIGATSTVAPDGEGHQRLTVRFDPR